MNSGFLGQHLFKLVSGYLFLRMLLLISGSNLKTEVAISHINTVSVYSTT